MDGKQHRCVSRFRRARRHQSHQPPDLAVLDPLQAVEPHEVVLAETRLDRAELLAGVVLGMRRDAWNLDGAGEGQDVAGSPDIVRAFLA